MTKVTTIKNYKGGVGKSTHAVSLAAGLATKGYHIGLVDTDSQGHASLMLSMPDENGLYRLLIDKVGFDRVARLVPAANYSTADLPSTGALYLIPSSDLTFKVSELVEDDDPFILLDAMDDFGKAYQLDMIILDASPSFSKIDATVNMATDYFIYVTECNRVSYDGVQKAVERLERFSGRRLKHIGRESRVLGVIPNKMKPNTVLHRRNITVLAENFPPGLIWTPVFHSIAWEEAADNQETIYTWAPGGQAAESAWDIVGRVEKVLMSDAEQENS